MDQLRVTGGACLQGEVTISGAKNAALPILAATLLSTAPVHLHNIPNLADIRTMCSLLRHLGANISGKCPDLTMDSSGIHHYCAPYDLVKTMRASIVVLGPLLARFGYAQVSLPGGCAIGARPIDWHLQGLEALGAEIMMAKGYVTAKCEGPLKGADYCFPGISVTGTANLMMAATLAEGQTRLLNAACEPEITDLANFLNAMGAKVSGAGSQTITIDGVKTLSQKTDYAVMSDRIEAATFLIGAVMTQGRVKTLNISPELLHSVLQVLGQAGAMVESGEDWIQVSMTRRPSAVDVTTAPYPGYPTDAQAQILAMNTIAQGMGQINEMIFENRFMHVQELRRLNAVIDLQGHMAVSEGKSQLVGAPVMATDLRASACLVLAGLVAKGETLIERVYHIDRGYEQIEAKLTGLGAKIERVKIGKITDSG